MTTDDLALFLLAFSAALVVLGLVALHRHKRQLWREAVPPDYRPPTSIADWRERAEASQRRSDARRNA